MSDPSTENRDLAQSVLANAQDPLAATCGVGLAILALHDLLGERLPALIPTPTPETARPAMPLRCTTDQAHVKDCPGHAYALHIYEQHGVPWVSYRCTECHVLACGDITDADPCMEPYHHDVDHHSLRGVTWPIGGTRPTPTPEAGPWVEIGGQRMTQAQYDAAQFPLLHPTSADVEPDWQPSAKVWRAGPPVEPSSAGRWRWAGNGTYLPGALPESYAGVVGDVRASHDGDAWSALVHTTGPEPIEGQCLWSRAQVVQVQADAYAAGRRDERTDAVAWLATATANAHRDAVESDGNRGQQAATALAHATAAIRAGEHR